MLKRWYEDIRRQWCETFHESPMCPVHGHWECRRCHVIHSVKFEVRPS